MNEQHTMDHAKDDDWRDLIFRYVAGSLPASERADFQRHLLSGCPACGAEVRAQEALAADLALLAPPATPAADLEDRLFARLHTAGPAAPATGASGTGEIQVWKHWKESSAAAADNLFLRADDSAFEPTARAGIRVRKLFVDPANDRAAMLIRMEPGASYPSHRHGNAEECYVLAGDLRHGDRVMRAGDFERVTGGTRHGRQWTEEGCLLLIHSSLKDELLEG